MPTVNQINKKLMWIKQFMHRKQNIFVTVDTLILANRGGKDHILLIERKNDPYKGKWAFPGGFVEDNEDLEEAAKRELKEETGISAPALTQYKAVGTPGRDPRGRTVTVIFFGAINADEMDNVNGADDAVKAQWFPLENLPTLAFDHSEILKDFKVYLK